LVASFRRAAHPLCRDWRERRPNHLAAGSGASQFRPELIGSGFGSASMGQIFAALAKFFATAAQQPFQMKIKLAPLRDVEALWNENEKGARLVFRP
jgi:hypothetical protein